MDNKGITFFKIGAWILLLAGFAHAAVAVFDTFSNGAFSPTAKDAIQALKDTTPNIVLWLNGSNTSVFGSAWATYIGFSIGFGLMTGFGGLLLVLFGKDKNVLTASNLHIPLIAVTISAMLTLLAVLFFFWFPMVLLTASLICFVTALLILRKGAVHVTG